MRSYLNENVAASVYDTEINVRGDLLRWPRDTPVPATLALTSPKNGGQSVGITRLRTESHGVLFVCLFVCLFDIYIVL
jgi:hypothetical protein